MKVAIVHDYFVQDGGAERVCLALHQLFPEAPIFTLFHDPDRTHAGFRDATFVPSYLNTYPGAPSLYQAYLPLMPRAVESLDVRGYDLVLSSSSSFAKGVIASPHALHVSYIHTPTRFLWEDRYEYVQRLRASRILSTLLPPVVHRLRVWDTLAAARPDVIITNSLTSQARIKRYYRRESSVIHPPVDVETIPLSSATGTYWLGGGRLVGYKRFDLIVHAFNELGLPLKLFGTGPELRRLQRMARPNIEFLGHVSESHKHELFGHAIGFLYPQMEDFGITLVEAMAAGKPVLAYGRGGASETVLHGTTGLLVDEQSPRAFIDAIRAFDPSRFQAAAIRAHAEQFSVQRFKDELLVSLRTHVAL